MMHPLDGGNFDMFNHFDVMTLIDGQNCPSKFMLVVCLLATICRAED